MAKLSQEELLYLARMSGLTLQESEIPTILHQIESVLSYAERVTEIAGDALDPAPKNSNVFRPDEVIPCDSAVLLAQAPDEQEGFFVVPKILGNTQG